MMSARNFIALALVGPLALLALAACGSDPDVEAKSGQTSVGDGAGQVDGGTLADGAPIPVSDAAGSSGDGGASAGQDVGGVSDGGGSAVKDAGGAAVSDAGGSTTGDSGGTAVTDGGTVTKPDGGATTADAGGSTVADSGGSPDVPDNPNAKYKVCSELFTCAQIACDISPTPGCESICTKVSSNAANAAFKPFADCMWKGCYATKCAGAADKKACTQECYGKCGGLIYQCAADGQSGSQHCGQGFECLQACGKKGGDQEFACSIGCYKAMSPAAQKEFDDAFNCVALSQSTNPWTGCTGKLLKCASGGAVGTKSCVDLSGCMEDCDDGFENFACTGKCYGTGTAKAQADYNVVFECMMKSSEAGTPPLSCIEDFLPCADPSGELTCLKVWPCVEECKKKQGAKDGACTFQCLHQASYKEAKSFLQLVACMEGVCKPQCKSEVDPVKRKACEDDCNKKQCATQLSACLG